MKYVKNNRYGDPVYFVRVDESTVSVRGDRSNVSASPNGNAWDYSSIKLDGMPEMKIGSTVTLCNKNGIAFRINKIEDDVDNTDGDYRAFMLIGYFKKPQNNGRKTNSGDRDKRKR